MQEHQDPDQGANSGSVDLDDAVDDLLDDDFEGYEVEQFDAASLVDPAGLLVDEVVDVDEDEFDEDEDEDEDDDDFLVDEAVLAGPVAEVGEPGTSSLEARLARLEAAAQSLAAAEVTREGRKVRRKVTASTTGAGAIGFVPILLQLVGAIDLDPELAATVAAVAAAVGSFAAGWLTPERTPPLPDAEAQALLELGRPTPGV